MSESPAPLRPGGPPFARGLYLTGEDNLRLTTWGTQANRVVSLEGRTLKPDGSLEPFVETQTPSSDRSAVTSIYPVSEGLLTNLHVRVSTGASIRGHIYAIVELVRGQSGGVLPLGTLLSGYVTSAGRLAWPEGPNEPSPAGFGRIRLITGTNPAAGAEISETVPTGARWKLRTFIYTLVTSAAVANRRPVLTIDDGATTIWESFTNVAQTATQTAKYRAGVGVPFLLYDTLAYHLPLPSDLLLPAAARIRTVTALIDVADDYGAPVYAVEEWLEP
jgi:hypothetical protein